ncbi:PREDICTED: cyclin-dependent kinase 20-like, partial [Lepidothrix coronata]|uniref:Cyclin-dependent kinase 20 n=1 Tax=Lepidothrix coronata TaxID=321398 RepID=A0A6J0JBY1_9PASS
PPVPPQSGELVALKKVPLRRPEDGIPPQTLREIKALREMEEHPHVIRLWGVFAQGPAVVLALELLVGDLGGLLRAAPAPLSPPRVRALLAMTLRGLRHVHGMNILHRVGETPKTPQKHPKSLGGTPKMGGDTQGNPPAGHDPAGAEARPWHEHPAQGERHPKITPKPSGGPQKWRGEPQKWGGDRGKNPCWP